MIVRTIRNLVDPHYLKKWAFIINFYFGIPLYIILFVAITQRDEHNKYTNMGALHVWSCGIIRHFGHTKQTK